MLSILYLRCLILRRAVADKSAEEPFNSLFEMLSGQRAARLRRLRPFNSLFEMLKEIVEGEP